MDEKQKKLLIHCVYKHFEDDSEYILTKYPLTGPNGLRRMLGEIDREYFCKAYLSDQFEREFGEYAIEILDTLSNVVESNAQEKQAVVAPRGHGKSTLSTYAIPAWVALYKKKRFVLFISANGDTSANFLDKIKKAIESNYAIIDDFGEQKGRIWNADNICLRNGVWIACTGWKSGIRGLNKDTRPDLIICHKKGTPILYNNTWIPVESHPSFIKSYNNKGIIVDIFGMPFSETVTKNHKYWAREILPKRTNIKVHGIINENWVEAQNLTKNHYIGYRIDFSIKPFKPIKHYNPGIITERNAIGQIIKSSNSYNYCIPKEFNDTEWWWFFGLWWGDGHTAGKYQVGITINNKDIYIQDRIEKLLQKYNIKFTKVSKIGCCQLIFSHATFNRWLKTWRYGNSNKIPPNWVETIDFCYQKELIKGYFDADGFVDYKTNNVRLTSIYLPALLCAKRILARLGIAASIRNGVDAGIQQFPNGYTCNTQKKYDLRFRRNASILGYSIKNPERYKFDKVFISNGFLWSKIFEAKESEEVEFCPIKTEDHIYHTHFGISHNCDDLEDKSVIESESLRSKLESCFKEEIGRLGYYKTDFFYIGTLLSEDSLLARVTKEPAWKTLFYKCVISFPEDETLWEQWRLIYRNIYNPNRMDDAYKFYLENKDVMLKGTNVLWPERFPEDKMKYPGDYYNVMLEREAWGEDAFWKEAQNEPRNSKDKKFNKLMFWDNYPTNIKSLKLAIDPSEGKGDSTAYACGGELNGGYFIKEGKLALHNPYQIMDEVVRFIKDYPEIDEIILESNLFRDLLRDELIKRLIQEGCYRTVTHKHSSENKHIRIMQIEPDITGEKVFFNKINVAFNEQVKDYSKTCSHDDAVDSLQILLVKLKKPSFIIR